jgi:hypothetical protein
MTSRLAAADLEAIAAFNELAPDMERLLERLKADRFVSPIEAQGFAAYMRAAQHVAGLLMAHAKRERTERAA